MFTNKGELVSLLSEASKRVDEAKAAHNEQFARLEAVGAQMKLEAAQENYARAAQLKEELEKLQDSAEALYQEQTRLAVELDDLLEAARVWTFGQPEYAKPTKQTITQVRVVNPFTDEHARACYFDSEDTLTLQVGDKRFCDEAWNLSDWVQDHRLLLDVTEVTVTVDFTKREK